jgi:hypothetical protein
VGHDAARIMPQGGNSIHLQPSFRNSLLPSYLWALSHLDSLVGARIEEVGILHVEQKTNILAGNRPCALVKTRYEWQLLNWVSWWRKASAPVTSAKLTVAVTGLGVPVR